MRKQYFVIISIISILLQYPLNGEVEDGGTVTVTGPGSWSLDTMCVDWDNDNNLVVTCGLDITAVNTDTQEATYSLNCEKAKSTRAVDCSEVFSADQGARRRG